MNFFTECEIIKAVEMKDLKGGFDLPFLFHIKDINEVGEDIYAIGSKRQKDLRLKKTYDNIIEVLDFVDLRDFKLEKDDDFSGMDDVDFEDIGNHYVIKNAISLYNFLCYINYNESDFNEIAIFVMEQRNLVFSNFVDLVIDRLDINKKHTKFSEAFMQIQLSTEFSSSCIFEENIGKSYSRYSFREMFLKRMYVSRKYFVENKKNEEMEKRMKRK